MGIIIESNEWNAVCVDRMGERNKKAKQIEAKWNAMAQ